ncbi:hypothetical protein ABZ319_00320 [Nocardia sp. NPDC005978]|uniref:hypothetical protein n=1 Tax=Nocardia sp. NPDC005978 TaxID=3156725 RepID=UPI0033B3D77A
MTARETSALRALNAVGGRLPLGTWRVPALVRARERIAAALGMGQLRMVGTMPSGHTGILMPERMYLITESTATLDGLDFGSPARLDVNPVIGEIALPARGVLAIGQAMWEALDPLNDGSRTGDSARDSEPR